MLCRMVTQAASEAFLHSRQTPRWEFPRVSDQSPEPEAQDGGSGRLHRRSRLVVAALIGLVALSIVVSALGIWSAGSGSSTTLTASEPSADIAIDTSELSATPELVVVHVSGAVGVPGLVELEKGSRVNDAVSAAGGAGPDADLHQVNLARSVLDGEHIIIPRLGEQLPAAASPGGTGPISLSQSPPERLQELPGVGPALASRIVSWREANGAFVTIEDVLAVSGIGPATLEKFRDQVVP